MFRMSRIKGLYNIGTIGNDGSPAVKQLFSYNGKVRTTVQSKIQLANIDQRYLG